MTVAEQLAEFVVRASFDALSVPVREQLKIRVLDALGCAIGALDGEPIREIRKQLALFGGAPLCTLVGGERTAPDRAAFATTALVRYLDFNDSYLSKIETCHPSDNLGAVLAAAEYAAKSGRDFLTALAVAYQVQCRLSDAAPVRAKGFDHPTQGSYAVAAGVAKALGLDPGQTTNALGMCGAAFNALRVTRTNGLSNWASLAYANTALGCTHATFLAMLGITGPRNVFDGTYGFKDVIAGPFQVDWATEPLDAVLRTDLKKYDADVHAQTALEGILELRRNHGFGGDDVDRIEVDTYDVAYNIIGGGTEGERLNVHTKEQADHSLPYLVAVAILDGQVMPEQSRPERIGRRDVQTLLHKVTVQRDGELSQ
ncbi:MAG TPA: MmgE/PrpD family protein, partial [Chloroflexota bacterium]|nr:MmgE/PrpD family protein [Chloroflexota bacterium]